MAEPPSSTAQPSLPTPNSEEAIFPYTAKLCLNGHEYAKRQLAREGIAFQALDNGVENCADPRRLQQICDDLSAAAIERLLREWLDRLPRPFSAATAKPTTAMRPRSCKRSSR